MVSVCVCSYVLICHWTERTGHVCWLCIWDVCSNIVIGLSVLDMYVVSVVCYVGGGI